MSCSRDLAEDNKVVVSEMIAAMNARDFEKVEELIADDVKRHCSATPGVMVENREQFMAFLHQDLSICPDASQEINLILAEDDRVAVHVTYRGTQTGAMGPFPPSGRSMELPFIGILRVQNGKIAEIWVEWDNLHALSQLGHFPPAPPAEKEDSSEPSENV
jgi:steroid delta-isomerase-like uncharacterized protein